MPRIRADSLASEPVDETSSDGASWFSWRMSFAPLFCSVSALTAEIATGTSDRSCERPCAVTMIGVLSLSSVAVRSEEHTSELQSLMRISYAVFCLNKKNNNNYYRNTNKQQDNH